MFTEESWLRFVLRFILLPVVIEFWLLLEMRLLELNILLEFWELLVLLNIFCDCWDWLLKMFDFAVLLFWVWLGFINMFVFGVVCWFWLNIFVLGWLVIGEFVKGLLLFAVWFWLKILLIELPMFCCWEKTFVVGVTDKLLLNGLLMLFCTVEVLLLKMLVLLVTVELLNIFWVELFVKEFGDAVVLLELLVLDIKGLLNEFVFWEVLVNEFVGIEGMLLIVEGPFVGLL